MNKNKTICKRKLLSWLSHRPRRIHRYLWKLNIFSTTKKQTRRTQSSMNSYKDQEARSCDQKPSQRISNLVSISILWVTLLGLSTTIFPHPFKDNAFYLINLSYISFVSFCIGIYAFDKRTRWKWVNRFLNAVAYMNGLYFGLGAIGEIINLVWNPYFVINRIFANSTGVMFALLFQVGILLAFIGERKKFKL